jgi:hypothetical protein
MTEAKNLSQTVGVDAFIMPENFHKKPHVKHLHHVFRICFWDEKTKDCPSSQSRWASRVGPMMP